MKKLTRTVFAVIAGISLFAGIAQAQPPDKGTQASAAPLTADTKAAVIDRMGQIITKSAFAEGVDFSKWNEYLAASKDAIDKADTPDAFVGELNRVLQKFGSSHIVLSSPRAATQRKEQKMVGLGVRVEFIPEGGRIVDIFPGGPASVAKIEIGDIVLEANGKKPESPADIAGPEGTKLHLKIKRDAEIKEIDVIRKAFSTVIPETLTWPQPDVALLKIPSFDVGYNSQNVKDLMAKASSAKLLVLDLRSNGGGAVMNLLQLAGMLLPENSAMGTFINRQTLNKYMAATGKDGKDIVDIASWTEVKLRPFKGQVEPFAGKVVVLINGGTGSASEMMAAALKEVKGAEVIGTKSAGAVLASLMAPLPEGYVLQFPFNDYVTIKGVRLEGNGVKPDIEAATPRTSKDADKGLEEALKWWSQHKKAA